MDARRAGGAAEALALRRPALSARWLAALLAIPAAGCISYSRVHGYMPAGEGVLEDRSCGTNIADALRVPLADGVQLLLAARPADIHPTPFAQIGLAVGFLVPAGVSLELAGSQLVIASPEWPETRAVPIRSIVDLAARLPADRSIAAHAAVRGSARTAVEPGLQLAFVDRGPIAQTSLPAVESFEVRLPGLRVNGAPVRVAPVRFGAYRTRAWVMPCD